MDWLEPAHLWAAAACLVACAVLGWFVPTLVGRIPEPEPAPEPDVAPDAQAAGVVRDEQDAVEPVADEVATAEPGEERKLFDRSLPAAPDKVPYAEIAAAPHFALWAAAWSGLVGACFGAALGWTGALIYLVPLVPIGVALMVVDLSLIHI